MGYGMNSSIAILSDADLAKQKAELLAELESLALEVDKLKSLQQTYKTRSEDVHLKEEELASVKRVLQEKSLESVQAKNEVDALGAQVASLRDEIVGLNQSKAELKKKEVELMEVISRLSELKKDVISLESESASKERFLEGLEVKCQQQKEELRGLEHDRDVLQVLVGELKAGLDSLEKEVLAKSQEKNEILAQIKQLQVSIEEAKLADQERLKALEEALVERQEIFDKQLQEKLVAVEAREGDLSLKENWLADKEATLKLNKEELEKFFNKKLPVII